MIRRRERLEPLPEQPEPERRHRILRRWAKALGNTTVDDAYLMDGEL